MIKSSIKSSSSLCGCGLIRFDWQWSVNISKQIHNYHHIFIQTLLNPNWRMEVGPCDITFFKLIHACENKNMNIGHVKKQCLFSLVQITLCSRRTPSVTARSWLRKEPLKRAEWNLQQDNINFQQSNFLSMVLKPLLYHMYVLNG